MFRKLFVLAAMLALFSATPAPAQTITLGEPVKGVLGGKHQTPFDINPGLPRGRFGRAWMGYGTILSVDLKAGQGIELTLNVTGEKRMSFLALLDPTSKVLKETNFTDNPAELTYKAVNAPGKFKLVVFSDQIGPFTLQSIGAGKQKLDPESIKKKIKQLEEEIENLKKQLKAKEDPGNAKQE